MAKSKQMIAGMCLLALLQSCAKVGEPVATQKAGADFEVSRLFTADECTVYRFIDSGRHIYFTNCSGSSEWQQSCGKNCYSDVGVSGGRQ